MSIYERDYQRDSYSRREYFMSGGPFAQLPPATRYILIINIAVFLLTMIPGLGGWIYALFSVFPKDFFNIVQVWRLVTYQFLHGDFQHIFFNMISLIIFGPMIETSWGTRAYLRFYLIAGLAGGVVYTLLAVFHILPQGSLVGASGSILGLIAVAGLLFPMQEILLMGIIPVRMYVLAIIATLMALVGFLSGGQNAGGEAAHLSGIAVGVFYVTVRPRLTHWRMVRSKGAWQRKLEQEQRFTADFDRVLDKVHREGIGSLTNKEKEILREATRREKQEAAKCR